MTGAGNVVQQVEQIPIPPVRIWDLIVSEYKVTYVVVGMPEMTRKSQRSLGVIHLPAGEDMPKEIDLYEEARDAGNHGASALYAGRRPR